MPPRRIRFPRRERAVFSLRERLCSLWGVCACVLVYWEFVGRALEGASSPRNQGGLLGRGGGLEGEFSNLKRDVA